MPPVILPFEAAALPRTDRPLTVGVWGGNRLLREYLGTALHACPDVVCAFATPDAPSFFAAPDVVLVEPRDMHRSMVRRLGELAPGARLVVLNSDGEDVNLVDCVRLGAMGFIVRDAGLDDVIRTVRTVTAGHRVIPRSITSRLCDQLAVEPQNGEHHRASASEMLTLREQQVLSLIAEGLSNKDIAERLAIATHTVKSHVHNLLKKMRLKTRVELVKHFFRERPKANPNPPVAG